MYNGTEAFDNDSGLLIVNNMLIIELKRGDFKLRNSTICVFPFS
jgi:hypothetical protein